MFYEDLRECGIDVREASVFSGVCTQIFREECMLYQEKVFICASRIFWLLYVFLTFDNDNVNLLDEPQINL